MEVITRDSLGIMKFVVKDYIYGLMVRLMKVIGRKTRCMDMGYYLGKMARSMRETLLMTRGKVKGHFIGQMEGYILEIGRMGNNTGEEHI